MIDIEALDVDYQIKKEELIKEQIFLQQYEDMIVREDYEDLEDTIRTERG